MEKEQRQALANPVRCQEFLALQEEREDREGEEDKTRKGEKIAAKNRRGKEWKAAFSLS